MRTDDLRRAVSLVAAAGAVPYGYTISLWSSGATVMHRHGMPGTVAVLGFAAGGLVGYALVGALAGAPTEDDFTGAARILAGALNWLAVGAAVASAMAIAPLPAVVAWPLTSLAATVAYLACAGLQLAVAGAQQRPTKDSASLGSSSTPSR